MIPKFRAFHKENKRIYEVETMKFYGPYFLVYENENSMGDSEKEVELMQWTDTCDKEGVTVCQDDLIEHWNGGIYRVVKEAFNWVLISKDDYQVITDPGLLQHCVIVGCFWTTPDLLEGAERE